MSQYVRLVEQLLVEQSTKAKLLKSVKLKDHYVFLGSVDSNHHVFHFKGGGNLSLTHIFKGSKKGAEKVFNSKVNELEKMEHEEVDHTNIDEDAQKKFKIMYDPTWGVVGEKPKSTDEEDFNLGNFHKHLLYYIKDWKGSFKGKSGSKGLLAMEKHEYYPEFRKMFVKEVKPVTLYRGVYGTIADDTIKTGQLPIHSISSWTLDKEIAKDIAENWSKKGDTIAIVEKKFDVKDIVFAPVVMNGYTPQKDILRSYLDNEREYIIKSDKKRIPVKVINKGIQRKKNR